MKIETMLKSSPGWVNEAHDGDGIVLSTIVRMVRNLPGYPFPGWSTAESRAAVAAQILPVIKEIKGFKTAFCAEMSDLSYGARRALLTRKQLTPCMAARQDGCHIVIPARRQVIFMINEEEHLVTHVFHNGNNLEQGIEDIYEWANILEKKLSFARTPQNGYLTSIPTEAGDGLQLYSILHLPGLTSANMMSQVTKALEKLHVSISPYFADAQDDTGHLFVLFSIPGPENSVDEMLENYQDVVNHLVHREQQVRRKLAMDPGMHMEDAIGRAYGMLTNCYRLSIKELRDAISLLRLGTMMGIIDWEEDPGEIVTALNHFGLEQATITAIAEENGDSFLCQKRAKAARTFLNNHPHTFIHFNS